MDDELASREEFVCLYQVSMITPTTLVSVIRDSLIRFNLSIKHMGSIMMAPLT